MLCFLVVNNTESLKGLCDYPDAASLQTIPSTHIFTYEFHWRLPENLDLLLQNDSEARHTPNVGLRPDMFPETFLHLEMQSQACKQDSPDDPSAY